MKTLLATAINRSWHIGTRLLSRILYICLCVFSQLYKCIIIIIDNNDCDSSIACEFTFRNYHRRVFTKKYRYNGCLLLQRFGHFSLLIFHRR